LRYYVVLSFSLSLNLIPLFLAHLSKVQVNICYGAASVCQLFTFSTSQ